jgi:ABC-2 type transport system permease protein
MTKLLAIIKREYLQRVRTKTFIFATILGPLLTVGLMVLPALIFSIKTGEDTRLAILDQSGKMYDRLRDAITREPDEQEEEKGASVAQGARAARPAPEERLRQAQDVSHTAFMIEDVRPPQGQSLEETKRGLSARVRRGELDAYIILPADVLAKGRVEYYGRNVGDVVTKAQLEDRLNRAVIEERLAEANINQQLVREMSRPLSMTTIKIGEHDEEEDSGGAFFLVLTIGVFILMITIMYGQTILISVIEEKETRMAEMLFSSVKSFPLMMGKLLGVSLVALTQYIIWAVAFALFSLYGVNALVASGMDVALPGIHASLMLYLILFSLLGYFIYSTFYLLVGSMVTTAQEGGQVAVPVTFMLVAGYMLIFPVIRSPNSSFAFWISMVPFFSPIIMPVRIVSQTPPFWQIALSLLIGISTVIMVIWLAARIYRVGMLMYGKRATLPEVWRWIRQA